MSLCSCVLMQEGEEAWLLLHQSPRSTSERLLQVTDVEALGSTSLEELADSDSRFIELGTCSVHYKLQSPEVMFPKAENLCRLTRPSCPLKLGHAG
jgi:hypothetical protein